MEKKFDGWKKSIKRSFGRKAGRDIAQELQRSGQVEPPQAQQQDLAHQPDHKQSQPVREAENCPGPPSKNRTWRTLKRSLGRKLGLRVRDELENEEQEKREENSEDPSLTFHQAIHFAAQEVQPENLQAEPSRTTVPPAKYKVKRPRIAGSEGCDKFSIRRNGAAVQTTANSSHVPFRNLSAVDLGTTPTTPRYPHPMEVVAPVPEGRRKYATWSARAKPFWCCDQHHGMVGGADVLSASSSAPVHDARVQRPGALQRSEGIQPISPRINSDIAQVDDGDSWPSSSNPGLLEPTLFRPVGSLDWEHRHGRGAQGDEGGVQIGYAESTGNFRLAEPDESVWGAGALGAAVQAEVNTATPEDESEEEGNAASAPAHCNMQENIYQATLQHQVNAGTPAADGGEPTDDEGKLQQIQASIAALQRAFPIGVEEGELKAIEEADEDTSLEDADRQAALIRQALLDVVYSQRAASSALVALAQSAETQQGVSVQETSRVPTPGEWFSSSYGRSIGESLAESSMASRPVSQAQGREGTKARAERVRNWLAERERKKKAIDGVDDSPATGKDTLSASSRELGTRESPLATSSGAALCTSRLRVRSRQQIVHESTANHRTSVVIDGRTYQRRQNEIQPMSQAHQNAGTDARLAVIQEDAEDLQARPTGEGEIGESGSASTVGSVITAIGRGPTPWPDGRRGDGGEVQPRPRSECLSPH